MEFHSYFKTEKKKENKSTSCKVKLTFTIDERTTKRNHSTLNTFCYTLTSRQYRHTQKKTKTKKSIDTKNEK